MGVNRREKNESKREWDEKGRGGRRREGEEGREDFAPKKVDPYAQHGCPSLHWSRLIISKTVQLLNLCKVCITFHVCATLYRQNTHTHRHEIHDIHDVSTAILHISLAGFPLILSLWRQCGFEVKAYKIRYPSNCAEARKAPGTDTDKHNSVCHNSETVTHFYRHSLHYSKVLQIHAENQEVLQHISHRSTDRDTSGFRSELPTQTDRPWVWASCPRSYEAASRVFCWEALWSRPLAPCPQWPSHSEHTTKHTIKWTDWSLSTSTVTSWTQTYKHRLNGQPWTDNHMMKTQQTQYQYSHSHTHPHTE